MQQTTSTDDIFRCIFLGALRVKLKLLFTIFENYSISGDTFFQGYFRELNSCYSLPEVDKSPSVRCYIRCIAILLRGILHVHTVKRGMFLFQNKPKHITSSFDMTSFSKKIIFRYSYSFTVNHKIAGT